MSYQKIKLAIIFDKTVLSVGDFQQGINASKVASKIDKDIALIKNYITKKME